MSSRRGLSSQGKIRASQGQLLSCFDFLHYYIPIYTRGATGTDIECPFHVPFRIFDKHYTTGYHNEALQKRFFRAIKQDVGGKLLLLPLAARAVRFIPLLNVAVKPC